MNQNIIFLIVLAVAAQQLGIGDVFSYLEGMLSNPEQLIYGVIDLFRSMYFIDKETT